MKLLGSHGHRIAWLVLAVVPEDVGKTRNPDPMVQKIRFPSLQWPEMAGVTHFWTLRCVSHVAQLLFLCVDLTGQQHSSEAFL